MLEEADLYGAVVDYRSQRFVRDLVCDPSSRSSLVATSFEAIPVHHVAFDVVAAYFMLHQGS